MSVTVENTSKIVDRHRAIKSDTLSYLLVREAGGLGDDIRIGAVARVIKSKDPKARVTVLGMQQFRDVFTHLEGIDSFKYVSFNLKFRRGRNESLVRARYLASSLTGYDRVIDLFCPGYNYETQELGEVTRERIDSFLLAAKFGLQDALPPVWNVTEGEAEDAAKWLYSAIDPCRPLVGLHRRSTDASRTYKDEMSIELIHRLYDVGYNVIMFDVARGLGSNPAIPAIKLPVPKVAAIIKQLDVLVCVDSGLLHIAGAVGTPIVGLFGSTDGFVIGKHYNCTPVVPYGYYRGVPSPCGNPCYYRPQRGWTKDCRKTGCFWLNLVYPPMVVAAVKEVLEGESHAECIR